MPALILSLNKAVLVMVFFSITKTEVDTRESGVYMTGLTTPFVGGIWKTVGLQTPRVAEHSKWSLMDQPTVSMEGVSAVSNVTVGCSSRVVRGQEY